MFIPFLMLSVTIKAVVMEMYREPDYEDVYQDAGITNPNEKDIIKCPFY